MKLQDCVSKINFGLGGGESDRLTRFRHREDRGTRNKNRETTRKRIEGRRFMVFWFETSGERLILLGLLSKRKVT